jgi:hypothetical protein
MNSPSLISRERFSTARTSPYYLETPWNVTVDICTLLAGWPLYGGIPPRGESISA